MSGRAVHKVMAEVILAATPGLLAMTYWFGAGILWNLLICVGTAIITEAVILKWRGLAIKPVLDLSAVATALLLALCLPPDLPWHIAVVAAVAAIGLGKQAYGGLGQNLFNPAMVGYAIVLIGFPAAMASWTAPDWHAIDAISAATPLDQARMARVQPELASLPSATVDAAWPWQTIALAFAIGGIWLRLRGLIGWQIPLAVIAGLLIPAAIDYVVSGSALSPLDQLVFGATIFGAFFIATDPVTAPSRPGARIAFGLMIGLLVFVIRRWGAYPDALAFAVLIANACVPLFDQLAHRWAKRS